MKTYDLLKLLCLSLLIGFQIYKICTTTVCPQNTWQCSNGYQCINSTSKCNSVIDCDDGSDEGAICNSTCTIDEFKCLTGDQCIRKDYLCDHDNDCNDGSDEPSNCTYPKCAGNEFTCSNKRCIHMNYVCDGDDDCSDGSDEKYCASRHCPPNQLSCNVTGICIDIEKFCNGVSDCPDGSDESQSCLPSKCSEIGCAQNCRSTPRGPVCYCPKGKMINPADNRTCIDVNECEMWDECDQLCTNKNDSYSCSCIANYTLVSDGHCSHQNSDSARIIFVIGSKIFETNKRGENSRIIFDDSQFDISSFDYNYATSEFYFADEKTNKIYKGIYSREGSSRINLSPVISENVEGPFSIAVDWITNKIYVAQKDLSRIDIFSADGRNRTTLLTSNIFKPTSLALDPIENLLFYTDSGHSFFKLQNPKIERVFMDGSGRKVIIKDKLLDPIAMTLDLIKKRIYWIDRKYDHLETCDYYGARRHILVTGSQNLPHSISLDIFENTIYYADTTKMAIMKLVRHTITTTPNVTYHYKIMSNQMNENNYPRLVRVYHETKKDKQQNEPMRIE